MCGLAAIINYSGSIDPVNKDELIRLNDAMLKRGPDSSGIWLSNNKQIGLAHRRLSIIDLSDDGNQPMTSICGRVKIVFNGEIYNYKEIKTQLLEKGYIFKSDSDTEVIINLYLEYGSLLFNYLRGMFAFVIWDELEQTVLIGRDHFGIKPLYYSDNDKTIRVASQVKALINASSKYIDTGINEAGYVSFYLWGSVAESHTMYKGISAIDAGSYCLIDLKNGRKEHKKYFSMQHTIQNLEPHSFITEAEANDYLRGVLLDSIKHHFIADVTVGVFLSGGIDSTLLLGLAKELNIENIETFTLGFKEFIGTVNDETILAQATANYYGSIHKTQVIDKNDFYENLDHIFASMDQPTIDGINTYFVSKGAKEAGNKVVLSGIGGDEIFAGYSTFLDVPKLTRQFGWVNNVPALGRLFCGISSELFRSLKKPKYAGILDYGRTIPRAYWLKRGFYMPWELCDFLDPELVANGLERLQTEHFLKETINGIDDNRLAISALESSWYMRNQLLRDSDWASMAHSLELRTPLVDIKVFEAMVKIVKSGFKCSKINTANSLQKPMPTEVIFRGKTGFSIPIKDWIKDYTHDSSIKSYGLRSWADFVVKQYHEK